MSIFAITSERFEALLYFYPFWVEHLSFITKYSEENKLLMYFKPFQVRSVRMQLVTKKNHNSPFILMWKKNFPKPSQELARSVCMMLRVFPFLLQRSTWVVLCCTVLVSAGLLSFLGVTHSSVAKITKQTAQEFHLLQAFGAFINQGSFLLKCAEIAAVNYEDLFVESHVVRFQELQSFHKNLHRGCFCPATGFWPSQSGRFTQGTSSPS